MSVHLGVWLAEGVDLSAILTGPGWKVSDDGDFESSTRSYIMSVSRPSRVFVEDVPDEVQSLVPGVAWLVDMALQGGSSAGLRALNSTALAIARACHGVVDDPQEGSFRRPSGVRRYAKPPRADRLDVLSLGWWAAGGPLLDRDGVEGVVATLQRLLPEAVPARWGLYEPPDHALDEEGIGGLVEFLHGHRDEIVIVTAGRRPFVSADFDLRRDWGWHAQFDRFEVTHALIEIDAQLLDQKGWPRQLAVAFEALSRVIRPFYGEARVRENVDPSTACDPETQPPPIQYNWWCGLPVSPPMAAVLGPPYRALWPEFGTTTTDGLAFDGPDPWRRRETLKWQPPRGLTQRYDGRWTPLRTLGGVDGYSLDYPNPEPDIWPFDENPA